VLNVVTLSFLLMQLVERLDGTRVKSDAAFALFRKSETSGVFWTTGGTTPFGFKRSKSSMSRISEIACDEILFVVGRTKANYRSSFRRIDSSKKLCLL